MTDLQYPIGRFTFPESTTAEQRQAWIREIASMPRALRAAVAGLSKEQLDTPYRPGGWTVRQVTHHVPDSHMNAVVRFKLALTEDQPTIKPYDEARWAVLADTSLPVELSLDLLEALHLRWIGLLESMSERDYQRTFAHPESGIWRLDQCLAQYAWHGRHHVAHVMSIKIGTQMRKLILLVTFCAVLRADFSYQETTQMTGGALVKVLRLGGPFTRKAREPIVSTVLIKGNRMATLGKENSTIIDLDKESITEINLSKKTYSVVTFAQMRQAMDDAMARAQAQQQKKQKAAPKGNVEAKFKVSAKATGKTKKVQNLNAKEMVVTMDLEGTDKDTGQSGSMTVIDDAWMATVPGYDQVKAFHQKMGQKMAREFQPELSRMAMSDPRMMQAMSEAAKEMSKVAGVPVETVMKMGSGITVDTTDSTSEKDKPSVRDAVTSRLPFGRKKKDDDPPPDSKQSGPALLLEMTTDLSSFSSGAVDASKFDIPQEFKQVDSDLVKRSR